MTASLHVYFRNENHRVQQAYVMWTAVLHNVADAVNSQRYCSGKVASLKRFICCAQAGHAHEQT